MALGYGREPPWPGLAPAMRRGSAGRARGARRRDDRLKKWRGLYVAIQIERNPCGGTIGSMASEFADADPESRADLADGFSMGGADSRGALRVAWTMTMAYVFSYVCSR